VEVSQVTDSGLLWADPPLDIDDGAERDGAIVADEEIRVLARASRLAIRCDPAVRHPGDVPGTDVLDFPLHCVAHAHPECRFRWVRVTLDLSGTVGACITDLVPRDEVSEHPVKISATYHAGVTFDIAVVPLKPDLSAERSTEQDVYYPKISVSGIDFGYAVWDFAAVGEEPLKVDRPLRLLAAVPAGPAEIPARVTLRAAVAARGFLGTIPLIGRQTKTLPLDSRA
jgi:hypothetical protein